MTDGHVTQISSHNLIPSKDQHMQPNNGFSNFENFTDKVLHCNYINFNFKKLFNLGIFFVI